MAQPQYNQRNLYLAYSVEHHRRMHQLNCPHTSWEEYLQLRPLQREILIDIIEEEEEEVPRTISYIFDGILRDYPQLRTATEENVILELQRNPQIYALLDDLFCQWFG